MILWGLLLTVYLILKTYSKFYQNFQKVIKIIISKYEWDLFLRSLTASYLDITLFVALQITNVNFQHFILSNRYKVRISGYLFYGKYYNGNNMDDYYNLLSLSLHQIYRKKQDKIRQ